ncbi:hypothetical protein [Microbacterium xanthum]|uniref:hypothetical protein n=1 Tax=Microbacterium xanthum TaxID=3079794 RepID=UPI002AD376DA|nr:hypothetical protein [Microbacterium sp. KSW-48]MDZ8172245.1 hypothetical protein [Microbacterium sp. KSW-48]
MDTRRGSRIGTLTRTLLAAGIGITVVALTATVSASLSDDIEGMRGAGVYIVSGLTFTAAGLVVYAVATHGAMFLRAVVEAGAIRRDPPTDVGHVEHEAGEEPGRRDPLSSPEASGSILLGGFALPTPPAGDERAADASHPGDDPSVDGAASTDEAGPSGDDPEPPRSPA